MDPLSDVLALLKLDSYRAGGFDIGQNLAIGWPHHPGVKCYAVSSGRGYLSVEGVDGWVTMEPGDCFILPRGLPFRIATDLKAPLLDFMQIRDYWLANGCFVQNQQSGCYMIGGHFALTGGPADILRSALPPIVHLRSESDRAALRWSLDRMREEVNNPRPGSDLIIKQLGQTMLVQALRLHLADAGNNFTGWLSALADKQMSSAISAIHADPGKPWTLQTLAEEAGMSRSVFAERFKQTVGTSPVEYLTRWRMLLASDRLRTAKESVAEIASSLGYDSESAFGKAFKRTMNCSPRQYGRSAVNADRQPLPAEYTNQAGA
ncbi:AraC family transcriptional regulator [Terriglobus aquaticus]|uniref:AraC family transcriptional regulator n=1 Tax=Terriglobus aquaticus TaxID=940139 RepID=A0ABW9KGP6_9BACT